jgi:hypothetical protein
VPSSEQADASSAALMHARRIPFAGRSLAMGVRSYPTPLVRAKSFIASTALARVLGANRANSGAMTPEHRRYLLLEQGVGSALFNFFLNGAIAWLTFRSFESVPMWGQQSIAGDTIGTTFFLPFFTCLIVTRLTRGQLSSGRLPTPSWSRTSHAALGRLPSGTWARSTVLGLVTLMVVAPLALWALAGLRIDAMSLWGFIGFKAAFAGVLAAAVTPVIALCALGDSLPAR